MGFFNKINEARAGIWLGATAACPLERAAGWLRAVLWSVERITKPLLQATARATGQTSEIRHRTARATR